MKISQYVVSFLANYKFSKVPIDFKKDVCLFLTNLSPRSVRVSADNRAFPIYYNSNVAPRLGGIKQKKLIIHPSTSVLFLLFYSPKPRSQVRILVYRKWSNITTYAI